MNTKVALRVYAVYSFIGGLSMIFHRAITQGGDPNMAAAITAEQSMGAYIIGLGALVWLMSETTGYTIINAADMDEAEAIGQTCPTIKSMSIYEADSM